MIDERWLLPREKPWLSDDHAEPVADLPPEQRGPRESDRKILSVNVGQIFRRIAELWRGRVT